MKGSPRIRQTSPWTFQSKGLGQECVTGKGTEWLSVLLTRGQPHAREDHEKTSEQSGMASQQCMSSKRELRGGVG